MAVLNSRFEKSTSGHYWKRNVEIRLFGGLEMENPNENPVGESMALTCDNKCYIVEGSTEDYRQSAAMR